MVYQLAIFGNPIAHSLSPKIHPLFAKQFGIEINYQSILTPTDGFANACQQFFDTGGYGCNITSPFKEEAFTLAQQHSEWALEVKAVNTIIKKHDILYGDNTDGQGLVNDLTRNKSLALKDKSIIVLGAGGAARGILPALLIAEVKQIIVVNRNLDRINVLLQDLHHPPFVTNASWQTLSAYAAACDMVIDATSSFETFQELGNVPWEKHTFFYDLKYKLDKTPLVHWAQQSGFQADDGFGMLVEQAALAFELWFGMMPTTAELIQKGARSLC